MTEKEYELLARIDERTKALEGKLKELNDRLRSVDHALQGNGQPGLKQRMAVMEDRQKGLSKILFFAVCAALSALAKMVWDLLMGRI